MLSAEERQELQELEELETLEQKFGQGSPVAEQAPPEPSALRVSPDLAANPMVRLGMGVMEGPVQIGANVAKSAMEAIGQEPKVSNYILEVLKDYNKAKEIGLGGDMDVAGLIGNLVPGGTVAKGVAKILPKAKSLSGRLGKASASGTAAATTVPVEDPTEDFLEKKTGQGAVGGLVGAASMPAIALGQTLARGVGTLRDMIRQGGEKNILRKYLQEILGDRGTQEVRRTINQGDDLIPGGKPTAAELVSGTPSGSPIQAHQAITAKTAGGISAEFGERTLKQTGARQIAERTRDAVTGPMREEALNAVNANGGVQKDLVLPALRKLAENPAWRDNPLVQKSLNRIRKAVQNINPDGLHLDAVRLYTVRKILTQDKALKTVKKSLVGKVEKELKNVIDDAITKSGGGPIWKQYLKEYATRSDRIAQQLVRQKNQYKPAQKTQLRSGVDIGLEASPHLPNVLSRPMMIANFGLKQAGRDIEPRIDALASEIYRNPQQLRALLEAVPPTTRERVVKALLERGFVPPAATTAAQGF